MQQHDGGTARSVGLGLVSSAGNAGSLGLMYAQFTDPDTVGNAYRWFAKRINTRRIGSLAGEVKDSVCSSLGSAIDDAFFNGLNLSSLRQGCGWQHAWDDDFSQALRQATSNEATPWWCVCNRLRCVPGHTEL